MSNSNGTFFVESLKDTNRNEAGFVDYERLYGVEGVGLANIVANANVVEAVEQRSYSRRLSHLMTGGRGPLFELHLPTSMAKALIATRTIPTAARRHLHSVTTPHNFGRIFSSPAQDS